jgi:hypothetical protein
VKPHALLSVRSRPEAVVRASALAEASSVGTGPRIGSEATPGPSGRHGATSPSSRNQPPLATNSSPASTARHSVVRMMLRWLLTYDLRQ